MIGAQLIQDVLSAWGSAVRAQPAVADISFFFASPSLGGSERVHVGIVAAVADLHPAVFFTEIGRDEALLPEFEQSARVFNLAPEVQSRFGFYTRLGAIAKAINQRPSPVVVGSYSFFFIRLVRRLAAHVRCIDVVHNFGTKYERGSLECAGRLNARVAVNHQTKADMAALYRECGFPEELNDRVRVIENCCAVPPVPPAKPVGEFKVLFVARGAPEKRVHLAGQVASRCKACGINASFTLVGELEPWVRAEDKANCRFAGKISDAAELAGLYSQSHALLLTSEREGFPLVVMEAMAHGCVPLCADVGGIRERVKHEVNGMLFEPSNETALVERLADAVALLAANRARFEQLSRAAFDTADRHFRPERFAAEYRALLTARSETGRA